MPESSTIDLTLGYFDGLYYEGYLSQPLWILDINAHVSRVDPPKLQFSEVIDDVVNL
ncbi:hypothetical protein VCR4J2_40024 [Vibrio coralliirubri]|nr:hypothetical protein VCR4J2_40024 [Vibrio coralliirubri]